MTFIRNHLNSKGKHMNTTHNDAAMITKGYEKIIKQMEKAISKRYISGFYSGIFWGGLLGAYSSMTLIAVVSYFMY